MSAPSTDDLSQLCLECGLCCSGAVFTHVVLKPGDRDRLRANGHEISADADRLEFSCQFLDGRKCTAYASRPRICSSYRCKTLAAAQSGEVSLNEARQTIREVTALYDNLAASMPGGKPVSTAHELMAEREPPPGMNQSEFNAMRLAFVALQTGIDHHIRQSGDAIVHSMPTIAED